MTEALIEAVARKVRRIADFLTCKDIDRSCDRILQSAREFANGEYERGKADALAALKSAPLAARVAFAREISGGMSEEVTLEMVEAGANKAAEYGLTIDHTMLASATALAVIYRAMRAAAPPATKD